jgi:hypothetical protein
VNRRSAIRFSRAFADHQRVYAKLPHLVLPAGPDGPLHLHEFDVAAVGVATARRAWVEKKDVLNTLPLTQLLKHLSR